MSDISSITNTNTSTSNSNSSSPTDDAFSLEVLADVAAGLLFVCLVGLSSVPPEANSSYKADVIVVGVETPKEEFILKSATLNDVIYGTTNLYPVKRPPK